MARLYGEPWAECWLCGFDYPQSQLVRHYKSRKLVDRKCADEMSQSDYLEFWARRQQEQDMSEQPVADQGEVAGSYVGSGAGEGGAGTGSASGGQPQ